MFVTTRNDEELNDEKIKLSDEERKKLEAERDRHNEERLIGQSKQYVHLTGV